MTVFFATVAKSSELQSFFDLANLCTPHCRQRGGKFVLVCYPLFVTVVKSRVAMFLRGANLCATHCSLGVGVPNLGLSWTNFPCHTATDQACVIFATPREASSHQTAKFFATGAKNTNQKSSLFSLQKNLATARNEGSQRVKISYWLSTLEFGMTQKPDSRGWSQWWEHVRPQVCWRGRPRLAWYFWDVFGRKGPTRPQPWIKDARSDQRNNKLRWFKLLVEGTTSCHPGNLCWGKAPTFLRWIVQSVVWSSPPHFGLFWCMTWAREG